MRFLAKTLVAIILACTPAFAEEPPARVGRVSLISGTLAFYGSGDADWSAAKLNYPVTAGEWFATDPQSRAEIRIGPDTIDIAGDSQLDITDLRTRVMQIGVTQGRIDLNLHQLGKDESAEIDIPKGGVWLLQPGVYDIVTGTADQPTRIAVFAGSARFVGSGADLTIKAGDAAILSGSDTVSAMVEQATPDDFVKWCRSRDYHEDRLAAPYHVPSAMTGFEELDAYGGWETVADYGAVWYPKSVPADWAPYRDGHWVWVEPWGWTWVDAEPWGFAPFHYGRWASIDDRWAWVPGNFAPEPVYAPALVAFIETPPDVVSPVETAPTVGWFPLAPGEIYWPTYTRNRTYIESVNIANVGETKITNFATFAAAQRTADPPPQMANQPFANRRAATVVPARVFESSSKVAPAALRVAPQALQQVPVSLRAPQLMPVIARPALAASTTSAPTPAAHAPQINAAAGAPGRPISPPNFHALAPAPSGPHRHPQTAQQSPQAIPGVPPPSAHGPAEPTHQPAQATPAAPPGPGHPPGPPNFTHLVPPAGTHGQPSAAQPPAQATPAAPTSSHPPGPPNFSHLDPAAGAHGQPSVAQPPAQATPAAPTPGQPPGAPNFSHLAPATGTHRQPPTTPAPAQAAQNAPLLPAPAPPPPVAQAPPPSAVPAPQARQHDQHSAAAQATAQQQAQQRAAAQAAAQQQVQQRAAARAAAQQQVQQRAAAQAAAQPQAQQRAAAAQAAAQQQAQQRAAAQAAAQQQAQQRAAAQAAAQQQAQQRAAAQAAAQPQAQQRAAAPKQQAQAHDSCGHPGQAACPR
jgi:hypothetical protein